MIRISSNGSNASSCELHCFNMSSVRSDFPRTEMPALGQLLNFRSRPDVAEFELVPDEKRRKFRRKLKPIIHGASDSPKKISPHRAPLKREPPPPNRVSDMFISGRDEFLSTDHSKYSEKPWYVSKEKMKEDIPIVPTFTSEVDEEAKWERRIILKNIGLKLPPPRKANRHKLVKKHMDEFTPFLKQFDITLSNGIKILYEKTGT